MTGPDDVMKQSATHWPISTEAEFEALMEETDMQLREASVPFRARPINGWMAISKRFGLGLSMFPNKKEPEPGNYSGDDLTLRIFRWFKLRYGKLLLTDASPGHTIAVVKGDPYRVIVPRTFGHIRFVCEPSHHGIEFYPKLAVRGVVTINILDSIIDLQPALSKTLAQPVLDALLQEFHDAYVKFTHIETLYDRGYGPEAKGDLRSSVDNILLQQPQYGASRWDSLQAAEKYLKTYLAEKNAEYPRGGRFAHDLHHIAGLAVGHGLPAIAASTLDQATCGPRVRYGEVTSSLEEAVQAHTAALAICSIVASTLGN